MKKVLLRFAVPLMVMSLFAVGTAQAAFTLYDKDGATFTTDAFFNTFYVHSSSNDNISGVDVDQSRVKMGFLPNYIGFNFSKQLDNMKVGGRSSFWVTINDSEDNVTQTGIDVRQFYGTVDGDWGQVLIGKDFGLFCRSNIFLDEILQGYGTVNNTLDLINGNGVSFGNIGTGYIYPFPNAQITYRTPKWNGLKLAIGIVDPARTADNFNTAAVPEEEAPQLQGELTYVYDFDKGSVTAWTGFLWQVSKDASSNDYEDVKSKGLSYGIQAKYADVSLSASGFTAKGVGFLLGPGVDNTLQVPLADASGEIKSSGYLLQASYTYGPARAVVSYGRNKLDASPEWKNRTATGALYYTFNDYFKVVAEYNQNKISIGDPDEKVDTIALGGIITF